MKYILLQNTSYTRRPVYLIRTLEDFHRVAIYKGSHIKPILISTSEPMLKSVIQSLEGKYTK